MVARGGIELPTRGLAGGEVIPARGARTLKNLICLVQDATPGGLELAPVGSGGSLLSLLLMEPVAANPYVEMRRSLFEIVGESNYQDTRERICGGRCEDGYEKVVEATLMHADQNPHDNKAIAVLIEGKPVGYLDRKTARTLRKQLAAAGAAGVPAVCQAMIVGGWDRGRHDRGYLGVRLDLPTK